MVFSLQTSVLILLSVQALYSDSQVLKPQLPTVNYDLKTLTACKSPLSECPVSDINKLKRELCYHGYSGQMCPKGLYYGCGKDPNNDFLVEGCFARHPCPAGSSNRIESDLDKRSATLHCVKCDDDHYEPEETYSDVGTLNGCSCVRMSSILHNDLDKMILVETGWPTRPDKYSCDINKGYSDCNGQMYCFVNKPCVCTKDKVCIEKSRPDLLPNGSCDEVCKVDRNKLSNFSCSSYMNSTNGSDKVHITTESNTTKDSEGPQTDVLAMIVTFVVLVISACSVILYCWRRAACRRNDEGGGGHGNANNDDNGENEDLDPHNPVNNQNDEDNSNPSNGEDPEGNSGLEPDPANRQEGPGQRIPESEAVQTYPSDLQSNAQDYPNDETSLKFASSEQQPSSLFDDILNSDEELVQKSRKDKSLHGACGEDRRPFLEESSHDTTIGNQEAEPLIPPETAQIQSDTVVYKKREQVDTRTRAIAEESEPQAPRPPIQATPSIENQSASSIERQANLPTTYNDSSESDDES